VGFKVRNSKDDLHFFLREDGQDVDLLAETSDGTEHLLLTLTPGRSVRLWPREVEYLKQYGLVFDGDNTLSMEVVE